MYKREPWWDAWCHGLGFWGSWGSTNNLLSNVWKVVFLIPEIVFLALPRREESFKCEKPWLVMFMYTRMIHMIVYRCTEWCCAISRTQALIDPWIGKCAFHKNVCGALFPFGTGVLCTLPGTWLFFSFSIPRWSTSPGGLCGSWHLLPGPFSVGISKRPLGVKPVQHRGREMSPFGPH